MPAVTFSSYDRFVMLPVWQWQLVEKAGVGRGNCSHCEKPRSDAYGTNSEKHDHFFNIVYRIWYRLGEVTKCRISSFAGCVYMATFEAR